MTPEKTKPEASTNRAQASKQTKMPRQFSVKSTHSEAQRQRIIEALRARNQTSYDLRRLGCYQAPARIKELRDRFGYLIDTVRVTLVDRDGYSHPRAALYVLRGEPEGA